MAKNKLPPHVMKTRMAHGVEYRSRRNEGDNVRIVWEGRPVGGTVFVSEEGKFGCRGKWHDTFEDAAKQSIDGCRMTYDIAKRRVDEYEAQMKALGLKIS